MRSRWNQGSLRPSSNRTLDRRLLLALLFMLVLIVSLALASETISRSKPIQVAPGPAEQLTAT